MLGITIAEPQDTCDDADLVCTLAPTRDVSLIPNGQLVNVRLYFGATKCQKSKHEIECVTAQLAVFNGDKIVNQNVLYCCDCNKYFIHKDSLTDIANGYGEVLVRQVLDEYDCDIPYDLNDDGLDYHSLRLSSVLNDLGYSAKEGVSDKERQWRLVEIVEYGFMRKDEIVKHLEIIIGMNKSSSKQRNANMRRKDDLQFLNDYGPQQAKNDIREHC